MLEEINKDNLSQVVDLHYSVLAWSINGQMGKQHIRKLYEAIFSQGQAFGFVYRHEGEVIGIITATTDQSAARSAIAQNYRLKDYFWMLVYAFKRPEDFMDIFETACLIPRYFSRLGVKPEILTWVTEPNSIRRSFAALSCMNAVRDKLAADGYPYCVAQVLRRSDEPNKCHKYMKSELIKSLFVNNLYKINCSINPQ